MPRYPELLDRLYYEEEEEEDYYEPEPTFTDNDRLILLFIEWLKYITPNDFDNGEGTLALV